MADKTRRRAVIRRLLQEQEISSQEHLAAQLAELGISCTQATLSRDLRDLGVARERTDRGFRYRRDPRAGYEKALRQVVGMEIMGVRHNGQLVVIRTLSGRAEGVAAFLDNLSSTDILGTVAGDDTVFVAPTDPNRCDELVAAIKQFADGEEVSP